MHKIQIISATNDKNLDLANSIQSTLMGVVRHVDKASVPIDCPDIISLESLQLPLFSFGVKANEEVLNGFVKSILEANSFIFCAPEYNGGVPPVLSNALTWISVQTKDWREAFNNKTALVATHSGGEGFRFLSAFRMQLEYLGVTVYSRSISVSNSKHYDEGKVKKILVNFLELIK